MVGHVTDSQKCVAASMVGSLILRTTLRTNSAIQMRALHGKKVSFDKVIKMVDDMVTLLGKEQVDDGSKKDMCEISIGKAEDDMQTFDVTISDLEKSIEDITREIVTITDEFAAQGSRTLKKMWPSRWTCTRRFDYLNIMV